MTAIRPQPPFIPIPDVEYPESDGEPMAESDAACDYLIYVREALRSHFRHRDDVYVAGNLFIYYEEGNPQAAVAPDVFVVFGVAPHSRRTFKVWEEQGRVPSFVMEITSKKTRSVDQGTKKGLYAYWGVQEYVQFDPTGDYLVPPIRLYQLVEESYQLMQPETLPDGSLSLLSQVLGLEIRIQSGELRFWDPTRGKKLLSPQEMTDLLARYQEQFGDLP